MPSPAAHSAARSLRTAYRRLWRGTAVAAGATLGLAPLIYLLPVPAWQRAVLGTLALLYLACKGYRLCRAHKTVRQLRMESCFIGHAFDQNQLQSCLQCRGHLWTHSYTVRALRRLMARPLPNLLVTDKKRERVHTEYKHALAAMHPSRLRAGLPLGVLLVVGVFAVLFAGGPAGGVEATWPLRLGMASALVLIGAEAGLALCRHRARRFFSQLADALADWTLARSVHDVLRGQAPASYRHTPLYRAPAWFASPAPGRQPAPSSEAASGGDAGPVPSRRRAA